MTGAGAIAVPARARRGRGRSRGLSVAAGLAVVWAASGLAAANDDAGMIGPPVPMIAAEPVVEPVAERVASDAAAGETLRSASGDEPGEADAGAATLSAINPESRPLIPADIAATPETESPDTITGSMVPEASGVGSTVISVAGVVALIVVVTCVAKLARRGGAGGLNTSRAPSGILEVLGRYPMAGGPTLMLLRVDRRVLLLSQARASRLSGATLSTLAEFEDVDQVASLLAQARDARDESISARFGSLLAGFNAEHGGKQSEFETGRVGTIEVIDAGGGAAEDGADAQSWPLRAAATAPEDDNTPHTPEGGVDRAASLLRRRLDGLRQWEGATA